MIEEKERNDILEYLFKGYLENVGTFMINLNPLIDKLGEGVHLKFKLLEAEGILRRLETTSQYGTLALLSFKGAYTANPGYFVQESDKAINALIHEGESCHLLLALGMDENKIQLAFDVVSYMQDEGLAFLGKKPDHHTLTISNRGREYYYEMQSRFL